ncbi:hypothetical protein N9L68_08325 [bacterium]|nr:hypothetical protein [bacterium]
MKYEMPSRKEVERNERNGEDGYELFGEDEEDMEDHYESGEDVVRDGDIEVDDSLDVSVRLGEEAQPPSPGRRSETGDRTPEPIDLTEEGEKPRVKKKPGSPTKREREEHQATHWPYKSWYRHCVRGRGRNSPHKRRVAEDDDGISRVQMDYHFMSQEDEGASRNPLLNMVDEASGNLSPRACGRKGTGEGAEMEWLIKAIIEELESWGYRGEDLILKCDQEGSL